MKAKPLYQREWIIIVIFMALTIVGNELQSAGDWKAVNWASTIGAVFVGLGRMYCKTLQDQAGIKAGVQPQPSSGAPVYYLPTPPSPAPQTVPLSPPPVPQYPQETVPVVNVSLAQPIATTSGVAAPVPGSAKVPQAPAAPGSLNDDMERLRRLGELGQASINEQAVEDKRTIVGADGA